MATSESFSQKSKSLIGEWYLSHVHNDDSTYDFKYGKDDQYFLRFFENGAFIQTHKRNDQKVKGTFYTVGRWKIDNNNEVLLLFDRRPNPPRKNTTYGDIESTIIKLSPSELILRGDFSIGYEGGIGTRHYIKRKQRTT